MAEKRYITNISIAQVGFTIEFSHFKTALLCRDYLTKEEGSIYLNISDADLEYEKSFYTSPNTAHGEDFYESQALFRKVTELLVEQNTILMHGAVVALDNQGYMFTAPSGIGKTTRTKLWLKAYPDSIIVNGDKPLIRIQNSHAIAFGTPWCGKEGQSKNTKVPLRAIFLLERSQEMDSSSIEEVTAKQAFPVLVQQSYRPNDTEKLIRTMHLLKALDGKIKFYKFRSAPTVESVRLAYETARPR